MPEHAKPRCGLTDDARKTVTPKLMTATAMLELSHDSRSQRKAEDEKLATISVTPNEMELSHRWRRRPWQTP
jgi:hypothetical protein